MMIDEGLSVSYICLRRIRDNRVQNAIQQKFIDEIFLSGFLLNIAMVCWNKICPCVFSKKIDIIYLNTSILGCVLKCVATIQELPLMARVQ